MLHDQVGHHYQIYLGLLHPILGLHYQGLLGFEGQGDLRIGIVFTFLGIDLARRTDGNYALPTYDKQ